MRSREVVVPKRLPALQTGPAPDSPGTWRFILASLQAYAKALATTEARRTVLIIDEAQNIAKMGLNVFFVNGNKPKRILDAAIKRKFEGTLFRGR